MMPARGAGGKLAPGSRRGSVEFAAVLWRLIPGPLVRWFARPYVAGGSVEDAVDTAARLLERDVLATRDLLGEEVRDAQQVRRNVGAYERLADALSAHPSLHDGERRASVSIKPSAFTTAGPAEAADSVRALARYCAQRGVPVTIDMEDRRWTDWTLDIAEELYGAGLDVGTVLQTRLNRTREDVERLPEGMRVRLVIGIYPEPAEVACTDKREMKERMVAYGARLLERGARVECATHDVEFLERFLREVAPMAPDRCELQMLLGVPRRNFVRRLRAGEYGVKLPVRLYIPFALSWQEATAYLRRRMHESPGIVWLVLRNLGGRKT